MGCCTSEPNQLAEHYDQSFSNTNPEQWSQQQILYWLKYCCNGELSALIKPFKKHKISGVAFSHLTNDELRNDLEIKEFGIRKKFTHYRDQLLDNYKNKKTLQNDASNTGHSSTLQSNSNLLHNHINDDQPKTPSSTISVINPLNTSNTGNNQQQQPTEFALSTQIKHNKNADDKSPLLTASVPQKHNKIKTTMKHNKQYHQHTTIDEDDEDEDEDLPTVITEDDCYMEPLVPPRFSLDTTTNNTNHTNHTTDRDIKGSPSLSTVTNPHHRKKMLEAFTHSWKNVNSKHIPQNQAFVPVTHLKWTKIRQRKPQKQANKPRIKDSYTSLTISAHSFTASPRSDETVISKHSDNALYFKQMTDIYDYSFLHQYQDSSYIGGSELVITGFLRNIGSKCKNQNKSIEGKITQLCHLYYYEHYKHVFQFAFDVWKILKILNKKEMIDKNEIFSFTGNNLVILTRKKYFDKYRFGNIVKYCNDLMKYQYIKLIAKCEGASKISNYQHEFINDQKYLYQFLTWRKREFKRYIDFIKYDLDREAWGRGTEVEIYSSSLNGWQLGEITNVGHHNVHVSYYANKEQNKYLFKTVQRNNKNLIRSTKEFIINRYKWKIGSLIQIYSQNDDVWYEGKIEEILYMDTYTAVADVFKVRYKNNNNKYYTKCIKRWSPEIRDIQIINNKKLLPYKSGTKCEIWLNEENKWITSLVKDIIPKHEFVVVNYKGDEQIIDVKSNCIRLIRC